MFDVDAYLDRIAYDGGREPTLETLRALQEHHLLAVPFENLDIHRGAPIRCDMKRFYEKVVVQRRGGFCYELNGLFGKLLGGLGFEVTMISARVRTAHGGFGPEFDHMALLVPIGGRRWLADVGYGDSFLHPVSLETFDRQLDPTGWYRVEKDDEEWLLLRDEKPEYRFTLTPYLLEDYAGMCHYHQTSPDSPFTKKSVCSLATRNGRITISGSKLIVTDNGARRESELDGEEAWYQALRDHFGVAFKDDPIGRKDLPVSSMSS